ncbi:GDSL esterase/lipase 7-like protein [Drosera capensis]
MRNQTRKLTFLLSVIFFPFLLVELIRAAQPPNISALFIFGDSLADVGNNNYLPTLAKCNYPPYGVDYPQKKATGRWTSGENVIDMFAEYLNMTSPPPFYSIRSQLEIKNVSIAFTGVSFASGSCGILPTTGKQYLKCSDFDMQLENFKVTLQEIESANFPNNQTAFNQYTSQSICAIVIGNNDYINNYLNSFYVEYKNYTCSEFAEILATNMSSKIQELYSLGCKKLVVANVAAVGCCPYERMASSSPPNTCNEIQNNCVNLYNEKLRDQVLPNFIANHTEVKVVYVDIWNFSRECTINPSSCGLLDSCNPCCTTYANGTCIPIPDALLNLPIISNLLCPNRSTHLFWDSFHPTTAVDHMILDGCTNPTNPYYPSPCDKPFSYLF